MFQFFPSHAHQLIIKRAGADAEIRRVILKREKHLAVGNAPGHHHIGDRVGFREHVFDLFAGIDVPLRNAVRQHFRFPLLPEPPAFANRFHDREGQALVQPHLNQIHHDIVAAADGGLNRGLAAQNQILGVAHPHVGAVGQTGDPHQIGKILRFGVDQHLHGEIRAELRHPQRPQPAAADVLRTDPQGRRILKQRHDLRAVQRNIRRVQSRQILQHTDHGRIIVSENIQFQQVMIDGMIVKMRGHGRRSHIVGRPLDRRERLDFLPDGQDNDAARVLSRRAADPHAAPDKTVNLAVPPALAPLVVIPFHIAVSGLVGQRSHGARPVSLPLAENHFRVVVRVALVLPGEIEIDIRLLVPLKSQKRLERNVMALLFQRRPAAGAFPVRHIAAGHAGERLYFRRVKIRKMTRGTIVVRA